MPYIPQDERFLAASCPENPGQLNFAITLMVSDYLRRKGLSYAAINEVVGVLDCAKLEFYRRIAGPYEDVKREQNGDVYASD